MNANKAMVRPAYVSGNAVTVEDSRYDEQRHVTIGMDAFGRILVVVYTWREGNIRIIAARKAVRYEVKQYEGEICF